MKQKPLVLAPLLSGTLSHLTVDPVNFSVIKVLKTELFDTAYST